MEITLTPTLKQHECYQALENPEVEEVFFGGGAGGGKSWALCESRLVRALRYPGYKSFIGRNELKRLMQSTYITWLKVCKHHNIPDHMWRLDGKYNVIEFINGSRIDLLDLKFLPVEDPLYERFGSLEYTDGAIEEAGEVHPLAHEVLKSRTNRHMNEELGLPANLLCTGNPKKNWTYHHFYNPWKKDMLPEQIRFIQSLYSDNPYTAASYGKTLSRIRDKSIRERLMNGNWEYEDDPAALIDFEALSDMFTNYLDPEEHYKKYITVDVARYGKDKTVVTLWEGWRATHIWYREKQGIDQTAEWLRGIIRTHRVPFSHVLVDEDGIGGGVVDILRGVKGFIANASAIKTSKTLARSQSGFDEVKAFSNIKAQCSYHLAEKINAREVAVEVKDDEIQEYIIGDLEQIKEANVDSDDKKRKVIDKSEVKATLGRSPDFGDTFVMRAWFDLKKVKDPEDEGFHQYVPKHISRKR